MTDHTIETLKTQRPRVEYTRRERVQRGIGRVLLAVSLALGSFAVSTTYRVAACTNTNLGQRSAPGASDAKAHISFAILVQDAVTHQPFTAAEAKQVNDSLHLDVAANRMLTPAQFVAIVRAYKNALEDNQATRDKHPLGKC